jgi:hypothetical protein
MRSVALTLASIAVLTMAGSATAVPTNPGRTVFDVTRNGAPFGTHTVSVSQSGETLRAQNTIALRAGVGPVTMFRLEQSCAETWADGALTSLSCSTLKDGRRTQVRAERQNGRLRVTGAGGETFFPLNAVPSTWWTRPPIDASSVIDTETGAAMPIRVTRVGRETITAGGARIEADHYRITGNLTADLWYDANGRWVSCAFTARGQRILYRLASPLDGAPA